MENSLGMFFVKKVEEKKNYGYRISFTISEWI